MLIYQTRGSRDGAQAGTPPTELEPTITTSSGHVQANTRQAQLPSPPQTRPPRLPPGHGTLVLLPNTDDASPACLDGSPYGFTFRLSSRGSTRWTLTLPGGGWCNTLSECADWTKHSLGSSATWGEPGTGPGKGTSWGESAQAKRCEDEDDNCVYLKYCDGGSFSGFRAGTVPAPAPDGKSGKIPLHFRGLRNFDATVEWALAHGMNRATEVVLTGISAGGVAVFVHVDRLAARVSTTCRVRALPIDAFFLDAQSYLGTPSGLTTSMARMTAMMGISAGPTGALAPACVDAHQHAPHLCLLPPVLQEFVRTPFFLLQTTFDQWQLANVLGLPWSNCIVSNHRAECNKTQSSEQEQHVIAFGKTLRDTLDPIVKTAASRGIGGFVTSCICHYHCAYGNLTLPQGGPTGVELFEAWLRGDVGTAGRVVIDGSLKPNGNGDLIKNLPTSGLTPLYAQPCTPLSQ